MSGKGVPINKQLLKKIHLVNVRTPFMSGRGNVINIITIKELVFSENGM